MLYCFLAPGFEEIEAVATVDTVRRGGLEVRTVGVGGKVVTGSHGIPVTADLTVDEFDAADLTGIILPGGMPGTLNLDKDPTVDRLLRAAYESGKLVAAICAAPSLLGKRGMLEGRTAVCYDGFEEQLLGARIGEGATATDGNVITARGAGVAIDFGCAIIAYFCGKEKAASVARSMKCPV